MSDALYNAQEIVAHLLGSGSFISIGEAIARGFTDELARQKAAPIPTTTQPPVPIHEPAPIAGEWKPSAWKREIGGVEIQVTEIGERCFFWQMTKPEAAENERPYSSSDTFALATAEAEAYASTRRHREPVAPPAPPPDPPSAAACSGEEIPF